VEANQAHNAASAGDCPQWPGMWATPPWPRERPDRAHRRFKDWGDSVKLAYVRDARHAASPFAGTKILSWAMNLTWLESVQSRGFDEAILLNERGEVARVHLGQHLYRNAARCGRHRSAPVACGITREVLLGDYPPARNRDWRKDPDARGPGIRDAVFITSTTPTCCRSCKLREKGGPVGARAGQKPL